MSHEIEFAILREARLRWSMRCGYVAASTGFSVQLAFSQKNRQQFVYEIL
jgi:hypothetical protein